MTRFSASRAAGAILAVQALIAWPVLFPEPLFAAPCRAVVVHGKSHLCRYLARQLPLDAGVQVVDDARTEAVFAEMGGAIRSMGVDEATYSDFCEYVHVDALIFVAQSSATPLTVTIHREDKVSTKIVAGKAGEPDALIAVTRAALEYVCDVCELPPSARSALLDIGFAHDEVFKQYLSSWTIDNPRADFNIGEARIRLLTVPNVLGVESTNVLLAAAILSDAERLHTHVDHSMAYSGNAVMYSQKLLPLVLNTRYESSAHAILRRFPRSFDSVLLSQCAPVVDSVDLFYDESLLETDDKGTLPSLDAEAVIMPNRSRAKGALRLLGVIGSAKGLPVLLSASEHADPDVREAAADGLGWYEDKAAQDRLRILADDKHAGVACAAVLGLWRHQVQQDELLSLVRGQVDSVDAGRRAQIVAVLASVGQVQDAPVLRQMCMDPRASVRLEATRGLVRVGGMDEATLARLLADVDASVVSQALQSLPAQPGHAVMTEVMRLANDPQESVAELARQAAVRLRPSGREAAVAFDLAMEHTYIRLKRMEQLRAIDEPWATDLIARSGANRNIHVRIAALSELARRDPERGRTEALRALRDGSAWVRFAAAEALMTLATPDDVAVLRESLDSEADRAAAMCMATTLARLEGRPPPAPPLPARSVLGPEVQTWGGDYGQEDGVTSPFSASMMAKIDSFKWRGVEPRTQRDGKANWGCLKPEPVLNAGLVMVDRGQREAALHYLDKSIAGAMVENLDGLMIGWRYMDMRRDELWPKGWRLFCLDAGIDPTRVRGKRENLSHPERRAWDNWAADRCIDGYNVMYDHVKWRVERLHPGFLVGTFLPARNARADTRWRFDVGALYNLWGDSRIVTYNTIRYYRTLWPDRPVVCISWGGVGSDKSGVQRGWEFPDGPVLARGEPAYADAVTSFLAGGDVGWWSNWSTHDPKWREGDPRYWLGVHLIVDGLYPGSPILKKAIEHAFEGVAESEAVKKEMANLKVGIDSLDDDRLPLELDLITQEENKRVAARIDTGIAGEKESMYRGFLFYGMYLKNCARVFSGLARQDIRPEILVIDSDPSGDSATKLRYPPVPGMTLPNQYDFLRDLNQISTHSLSRYRLILVHCPEGPLRDDTMATLTRWLREQPGLLYIHGSVATGNEAEDSVIGDMDGHLENDWPWENDISFARINKAERLRKMTGMGLDGRSLGRAELTWVYEPLNESCRALASSPDGRLAAVLWSRPDTYKGAALFDGIADASMEYVEALRKTIGDIHEERGVGLALDGPVLHQSTETTNLLAASVPGLFDGTKTVKTYEGLDLLTGELNPPLGNGPGAVMIGHDLVGRYVAAVSGLAILSENPLGEIQRVEGGIRMQTPGLVRVASVTGRVAVAPDGGGPLAVVQDPQGWVVKGSDEGIAQLKTKIGSPLTYYRCSRPVTITGR